MVGKSSSTEVSGLVAKVGSKRVEALLLIDRLTWKTLET